MAVRAELATAKLYQPRPIRLEVSPGLTPYPEAVTQMERLAAAIANDGAPECLWFVEHPPIYTAGTSAKPADLVAPDRFPVYQTGRGGQYTYHGPGQRVAYVMLDINSRGRDVRSFVAGLELTVILALRQFKIHGEVRENRVGIWVRHQTGEDKVAAIGIRIRKGVSFHGLAINVSPDLSHFDGIVPCGVTEHGVTSFAKLGLPMTMGDVDAALIQAFSTVFGPITK